MIRKKMKIKMNKEYLKNKYNYALQKTKELIATKKKLKQSILEKKKALKLAKKMPKQYSNSLVGRINEDKNKESFFLKSIQEELNYYSTYLKVSKGKDDLSSYKKIDNKIKVQIQKLKKEELEYKLFNFKISTLKYILLKTGNIQIVKTEDYNTYYKQELNKVYSYTNGIPKKAVLAVCNTMEEAKEKAEELFIDKIFEKNTNKLNEMIDKLDIELEKYRKKYKGTENYENKIKELLKKIENLRFIEK